MPWDESSSSDADRGSLRGRRDRCKRYAAARISVVPSAAPTPMPASAPAERPFASVIIGIGEVVEEVVGVGVLDVEEVEDELLVGSGVEVELVDVDVDVEAAAAADGTLVLVLALPLGTNWHRVSSVD